MIELEHSPLGGSAAHRFIACTGSFLVQRAQIENNQYENIESEFAKLGTAAHELSARCLIEGSEPFEYIGEEIQGYRVGWPDGISLDAVSVYVNECQGILSKKPTRYLVEETITLPHLHPLLKGTVDFGAWHPNHGIALRDYKNGEGVGVSAIGNKQMLYYGFLLAMHLELTDRDIPVSLGIVQPNFYGVFDEPDIWETTLGDVLDWGHNVLLPRMHSLTSAKEAPTLDDFVPGDHCQFCPVLLDCPKMQTAFCEYAQADEEFIAMLTDQELDHFYGMKEQARRFMTALEQTVHARLVGGSQYSSAKLVEKRVNRVWKPGAQAALETAFGEAVFKPKEIKSPAQVENMSSRGKEMSLEWGYKPESAGLSVAPMSDPRPEAKRAGNAGVFKDFEKSPEEMGF